MHTTYYELVKGKVMLKFCINGHTYFKTSNCPTCPICEEDKKPKSGFLSQLGAPARRALKGQGIATLKQLSKYTKKELLALHGMGPSSLPILENALKDDGLTFREEVE